MTTADEQFGLAHGYAPIAHKVVCAHRRHDPSSGRTCDVCVEIARRAEAAVAAGRLPHKVGNPRAARRADCHPDQKMKAKGKCERCYSRDWQREKGGQPSDEIKFRSYLKRLYGLSVEAYREIEERQQGGCGICGQALPLVVDHDHQTGTVRGLLCRNCNAGIGMLGDSYVRVLRALAYLDRSDPL